MPNKIFIILFFIFITISRSAICGEANLAQWLKGTLESEIPSVGKIVVDYSYIKNKEIYKLSLFVVNIDRRQIVIPQKIFNDVPEIRMDQLELSYEYSKYWDGVLIVLSFKYGNIWDSRYCGRDKLVNLAINNDKIAYLSVNFPKEHGYTTKFSYCANTFKIFCNK